MKATEKNGQHRLLRAIDSRTTRAYAEQFKFAVKNFEMLTRQEQARLDREIRVRFAEML